MQSLLIELTALLSCWLCIAAWQRDRTARGRRLFIAISAACCIWSAASLGQLHGALAPQDVDRMAFLAILPLPSLWLALALVVRGSPIVARAPWALGLLLAPGAFCFTLLFQDAETAAWFAANDPAGEWQAGPLFWANAGYAWAQALIASSLFVASARTLRTRRERFRRIAVGLLSLSPMLGNAFYVLSGLPGLDPTPVLLGASLVVLRSELFSGDLLQALPVSQQDLVNQLPRPLILTDHSGRVTEINPAAEACLAVAKADALERHVDGLLEEAAFAPEFERWSLVADGREAGFILLPKRPKADDEETPE
ncbi:MAG: histidine kinase N-terminal 7TM domain-containing protein [Myxococcota bacterium]